MPPASHCPSASPGCAYTHRRPRLPSDQQTAATSSPGPPATRLRRAGFALLALGAAGGGLADWTLWFNQAEWKTALPWWLAGLLLPLAGALLLDRAAERLGPGRPSRRSLLTALGAFAVGGLALFLRAYRLDQIPPGVFRDETSSALDALAILRGAAISPFATGWYETPTGYIYLQAAVIGLLGPTWAALKLPAIVAGVLTVLGVYFLGRLLFGTAVGLVAALFMAFARWPLHMSRWGWNETGPPLCHVWAVYFLVRGARSHRATDFALGGLVLGLGMYTYLSIRLALVAIAAYLVYRTVVERGFLRQHGGQLALFALLWGLTFGPLAVTYARNPELFVGRSSEVSIQRDVERAGGSLTPIAENIRRHLLMFNVAGDRNPRHNLPAQPMLDPVMGALLVLAVVRALALGHRHRWGLLLLWIPAVLLGGVLSRLTEGPQSYRTLGVMPAVALLCAELLIYLGRRLAALLTQLRAPRRAARGLPVLAVAAVLLWSGWANLQAYFVAFAADPRVYNAFDAHETAVARELASTPDPGAYYLSPRFFSSSPIRYFAASSDRLQPGQPPAPSYHLFRGSDDLPLPADGDLDAVLLWEHDWSGLASLLRAMYPHLTVEQVPGRFDGLLYERLTIPARDLQRARGLAPEIRD